MAIFITPSYIYLLSFRIITALGISCLPPVGFSILGYSITPQNRSKIFAYWSIAFTIGLLIGAFLALTFEDWRVPFLIISGIALTLTQLLLFTRPPPRGAKERALQELIGYQGYRYKYEVKRSDIPYLWKRRTNLWLVINFINIIPSGIMVYWGIEFFNEHGFEPLTSVFLYILLAMGIFLGPILFGRIEYERTFVNLYSL